MVTGHNDRFQLEISEKAERVVGGELIEVPGANYLGTLNKSGGRIQLGIY